MSDDPTLAELARVPLDITTASDVLQAVARHEVHSIEDLQLEPQHG